jgi:hypothetical protein
MRRGKKFGRAFSVFNRNFDIFVEEEAALKRNFY